MNEGVALKKQMIITMRAEFASKYARSTGAAREDLVAQVRSDLSQSAPSAKVVGHIAFSTRLLVDEREEANLRQGLGDHFLVENDYTLATL
jgi:hypothetical protein